MMREDFVTGQNLVAVRPLIHGDWKTALVFPEKWPTIPAGTEVTFKRSFINCYGEWCSVEGPNGSIYDVEPNRLKRKEKE